MASAKNAKPSSENGIPMIPPAYFMNRGQRRGRSWAAPPAVVTTITSHPRRSGPGVFEPLLTRHAGGGIGNREKASPWNGGPTLGADSVLAIRHPRQRDAQTFGPLSQPR